MSARHDDNMAAVRSEWVAFICRETGASEGVAFRVASQCLRAFHERFAGERIYIPSARYDEAAVMQEFDGRNRVELCRKYGIPKATFYLMLQRRRARADDTDPLEK